MVLMTSIQWQQNAHSFKQLGFKGKMKLDDAMSSECNCNPLGQQNVVSDVKGSDTGPFAGISASGGSSVKKKSVDLLSIQAVLPLQMTTKMKGLLKGLRCISQIFEQNDKEEEMQIGCPTDVKHVAHIGWDGQTVNQPAWMSGFKQVSELASAPPSTTGISKGQLSPTKRTSEGPCSSCSGIEDSLNRDLPELPKPSRLHQNQENPKDEQSDTPKTTRRRQSISNSATREASNAPKQPRRHSRKSNSSGMGSPTKESSTSKNTRRKKSTRSGDGGSTRSSRSRDLGAAYSDPDVNDAEEQVPTTKPKDEKI